MLLNGNSRILSRGADAIGEAAVEMPTRGRDEAVVRA
jgi:hypothetical protein